MKEKQLIESKELRDQMVSRIDVLEKVKKLLLIPGTDVATIVDIADFYEVTTDPIQKLYQRNKSEIDMDGIKVISANELIGQKSPIRKEVSKNQFKSTIVYENGRIIDIPNRGIKVFPRRAILRIGMLLRDSIVAKEIRNQLLNIEEKTSNNTKIQDIETEKGLMISVGMAVSSGDATAVAIASAKLINFKNRHIEKLEKDNKALAGGILDWGDKKSLNAGIRKLSAVTGISFGKMWGELYKELQYKHGICLKTRNNGKKPWIDNVKDNEWENIMKTFCAMCEAYGQSPSEMFQKTVPELV